LSAALGYVVAIFI